MTTTFLGQRPKATKYQEEPLRFVLHLDCDHDIPGPHWMEVTTGMTFYGWHKNLYQIVASRRI